MNLHLDRTLPLFAPLMRRALRPGQAKREGQFAAAAPALGRVVFLGDSITEWTAWEDWFPELPTTNRGIGGQVIRDVQARLPTAIVEPKAVSLLIGTNDLHGLGVSSDVDRIAEQMGVLVGTIRQMAPDAALFVNSVLPRSAYFRDRIVTLNQHYRQISDGHHATYIDVWPVLATSNGAIRPEMTVDGLHLSNEGYKAWVSVLHPYLSQFTL